MESATAITETQTHAIHRWREPLICCDSVWEENYARFETPEQEIRKFTRRFRQVGAGKWSSDSRILDLFCGRGNALKALERLEAGTASVAELAAVMAVSAASAVSIVGALAKLGLAVLGEAPRDSSHG